MYFLYDYSLIFQYYLDQIAGFKKEFGYLFSACSTSLFGGLVPFLVLHFKGRIPLNQNIHWLLFFLFFWAYQGGRGGCLLQIAVFLLWTILRI